MRTSAALVPHMGHRLLLCVPKLRERERDRHHDSFDQKLFIALNSSFYNFLNVSL